MADFFSSTAVLSGATVSRALQTSSTERPAVDRASVPRHDVSGNPSPQRGEPLPVEGAAMTQQLADAVARLNEILGAAERSVRFRIDETSGKTLIYVVNASTGEIVRQIPGEQVLALARRFGSPGALVDAKV